MAYLFCGKRHHLERHIQLAATRLKAIGLPHEFEIERRGRGVYSVMPKNFRSELSTRKDFDLMNRQLNSLDLISADISKYLVGRLRAGKTSEISLGTRKGTFAPITTSERMIVAKEVTRCRNKIFLSLPEPGDVEQLSHTPACGPTEDNPTAVAYAIVDESPKRTVLQEAKHLYKIRSITRRRMLPRKIATRYASARRKLLQVIFRDSAQHAKPIIIPKTFFEKTKNPGVLEKEVREAAANEHLQVAELSAKEALKLRIATEALLVIRK